MSECPVCRSERGDSFPLRFCKDCWIEMIREAKSAGQDFNEYWEIDDE